MFYSVLKIILRILFKIFLRLEVKLSLIHI